MKRLYSTLVAAFVAAMSFAQTAVTPPANATVEDYTLGGYMVYYDDNDQQVEEKINRAVKVAFAGSDVYVSGMSYYLPDAWIRGTLNGSSITIASPQYWGTVYETYPMYFLAMNYSGSGSATYPEQVTWTYDASTGNISMPESFFYSETDGSTGYNMYGYLSLTKGMPEVPEVVTLPEGVTAEQYVFSGFETWDEETMTRTAEVAINGSDVYVKGLSSFMSDAWVKGTLAGNKVTFAANQYLGIYGGSYTFFFSPSADIVLDYDATTNTLSSKTGYSIIYTQADQSATAESYTDVVITKPVEKVATPANPAIVAVGPDKQGYNRIAFDVYPQDTEGNALVPSKLFVQFYTDVNGTVSPLVFKKDSYKNLSEDISTLPYGFTDDWDFFTNSVYLYDDYTSWNKVGIQAIYTGGGETKKTEIQWFAIETDGINSLETEGSEVRFFDLQGREKSASDKGLMIKQIRQPDGTIKSIKVLRK